MAKTKRAPPVPTERFNKHFGSSAQWGERWTALYEAMLKPTRYTTLRNSFAAEADFKTVMNGITLQPIDLPRTQNAEAGIACYVSDVLDESGSKPFPEPFQSTNGLNTHWNLDMASLLAVSALDVQPGDKVLDLCAAPGGKSIALAQLIFANDNGKGCLHSNEYDVPRMKRLDENLKQYLPAAARQSRASLCVHQDGTLPTLVFPCGLGGYDKVLLDAPCSSERHIVHAQDRASRSKPPRVADELTRWSPAMAKRLAETQIKLLQNALRSVKLGGRVLYATCSISKEENDEVVETVLRWARLQQQKGNLTWICQPDTAPAATSTALETWAQKTAAGWIVLPDHDTPYGSGWGPLYFSVLTKVKPRPMP